MLSLIKTIKSKLVVSHLPLLSILLAGCASKVDEVKQQLLTSFIERADIVSDLASAIELNWWRPFNSAELDELVAEKNNIDSAISSLIVKVSTYQAFNGSWSQKLATDEP